MQVKFPTICANNPIKSTALPFGYQGKVTPDATKQCDLPECTISIQNEDWTVLTGCFHSFHNTCLNGLNSCPLCKDFLKEKVQELGQIAKQAILNPSNIWFYMQVVLSLDSTMVTGVSAWEYHFRFLLYFSANNNKTITTLNQSVFNAVFVTFTF